jgi:ATP-dependent DNA ligase
LAEQQKGGYLVPKILEVRRWDGKDMSDKTPMERRLIREDIAKKSKGLIHVPKRAMTEDAILRLHARETATNEGIVLRHKFDSSAPIIKVKGERTYDYQLVGIAPVQPKHHRARKDSGAAAKQRPGSKWMSSGKATGAGALLYKTDTGQEGKVGSGLTDDMRKDMWASPEKYLGPCEQDDSGTWRPTGESPAWVEVKGMESNPQTGIVRAPVLRRVRFDKTKEV